MTTEQKQQIERAAIDAIQDSKDYVAAYSDLNRSDEITAEEVDKIAELCFTEGVAHVIESPELYGLVPMKVSESLWYETAKQIEAENKRLREVLETVYNTRKLPGYSYPYTLERIKDVVKQALEGLGE